MTPSTHPIFWRDTSLPHVELRQVLDGRDVSYAPHFHKEWSIGAILDGRSDFICEDRLYDVERGALVLMNPDVVHACNPHQGSAWSYYMMHINKDWLATLLLNTGVRNTQQWQDSHLDTLCMPSFYQAFVTLCDCLMSSAYTSLQKSKKLQDVLVNLFAYLDSSIKESTIPLPLSKLYQIAHYLKENCLDDTSIELISAKFGLSTGYVIRTFKRCFHMTPHAYRLNCRVQLGQQALKDGQAIATVAHGLGFSDQAHFQRVFKQRVAATPNQYSRSVQ